MFYLFSRGEPTNFRGEASNFRGEATNFRGAMSNFRGEATNFRGAMSNFRGEATNFRGEATGGNQWPLHKWIYYIFLRHAHDGQFLTGSLQAGGSSILKYFLVSLVAQNALNGPVETDVFTISVITLATIRRNFETTKEMGENSALVTNE